MNLGSSNKNLLPADDIVHKYYGLAQIRQSPPNFSIKIVKILPINFHRWFT